MHRLLVWIHRYVGLAMALFLIVEGLTGSLLAFRADLTRLFDPALAGAPPAPGAERLDLATLIQRAEEQEPKARLRWLQPVTEDTAIFMMDPREDPETGKPYDLGFAYVALDPWTGKELKRLHSGMYTDGLLPNVMPFVYDFHKTLIFGETGVWILSILALLWTIDCFVGFYLTLPITLEKFWARWKPAWLVKWRGGIYRINFDLHRAGGLWLWPLLFVFAWSSVFLEPKTGVFEPVMSALLGPQGLDLPQPSPGKGPPELDWAQALARGEQLIAEQGAKLGFKPGEPQALSYISDARAYWYRAHTDRFFPEDRLASLFFDADTGEYKTSAGTYSGGRNMIVTSWLVALHMIGDPVDYLAYRIFVVFVGVVVAMLSITGVYVWWKKREARVRRRSHIGADRAPRSRPIAGLSAADEGGGSLR